MSYLTEAFKALDALNEETFDVSADGIKKLADFENIDDNVDETTIFDMDAETEDDIEDSYIGKVIIDCNVCHSKIYKDKDEVVIDDETNNANIDMECPYCYSTDGFKVIGEVAPMNTETDEKVEDDIDIETHEDSDKPTTETEENVELEESLNEATVTDYKGSLSNILVKNKDKISKMATKGEIVKFLDSITDEVRDKNYLETVKSNMQKKNDFGALQYIYGIILSGEGKGVKESLKEDIGKDIDEYQQWVDYDMKRYGKISNQTNKEIKEAGLQVVKDKYGDYQVIAGKYDESLKETEDEDNLRDTLFTEYQSKYTPDTYDKIYNEIKDKYNDETLANEVVSSLENDYKSWFDESLKESVGNDTKDLFGQTAHDKVFSTHIYNHYPFRGAIEIMDEVDENGEGRKLKFTSRDEMNSKADELLDNGYISYTYNRAENESLKECVKDVTITTDDSKTTMTSEDNGKVTVTTEPVEDEHFEDTEVIKPLDDETIQDIETNSIDDESEEDDDNEEETEFAENEFNESFSKLCENYLKENYSNVESFKATKSTRSPKQIIVEGLIKFTSGKVKNTKFSFNENISTNNHKGFQGKNLNITKDKAPFLLKTNSKMVCEALSYNYRTKNDENKKVRCKGIVKEG